jgi:hypothetical protein
MTDEEEASSRAFEHVHLKFRHSGDSDAVLFRIRSRELGDLLVPIRSRRMESRYR